MKLTFLALGFNISVLLAGTTTTAFDPTSLTAGPFPSDALTVSAGNQLTGHQINVPATACGPGFSGAVCGDTSQLNALDGFSVNPRAMVCFSAPVIPPALQAGISLSQSIILRSNDSTRSFMTRLRIRVRKAECRSPPAKPLSVNRQRCRSGAGGQKVKENQDFKKCLQHGTDPYCTALAAAVNTAHNPGNDHLVVASLFTTMSVTTWLEEAHNFVSRNEPGILLPAGLISSFSLSSLSAMTWFPDDSGTAGGQQIPLSVLQNVDSVYWAFSFPELHQRERAGSRNYFGSADEHASRGAGSDSGRSTAHPERFCADFVPCVSASREPASRIRKGFPLVIYGHGLGDNQFGAPTYIASTLASQGFATLAMEILGHGFGPNGYVQLTDTHGNKFVVATPGRGVAFSSGPIGVEDGCIAPGAVVSAIARGKAPSICRH